MKQILLLEDLPEIRAYLRALVVQVFPGSTVVESARIHDALQQVSAQRFDLAMVDLGLPDGSGVKVVQALRDQQPDARQQRDRRPGRAGPGPAHEGGPAGPGCG